MIPVRLTAYHVEQGEIAPLTRRFDSIGLNLSQHARYRKTEKGRMTTRIRDTHPFLTSSMTSRDVTDEYPPQHGMAVLWWHHRHVSHLFHQRDRDSSPRRLAAATGVADITDGIAVIAFLAYGDGHE